MTTSSVRVLHSRASATERAVRGVNGPAIVVEVPAGAEALIGAPLQGASLSVNGAYVCLIPIAGLASSLKVHTVCALTTKTASTSGPDELHEFNPRLVNVADAVVMTAGTGDGALTTTVLQTASLVVSGGIYAVFTLTPAGGAGTVVVTRCEVVGL